MYHTKFQVQVLPFQKYPVDRHRQSFLEPFHNGAKKGSFLGPCGRTMRLKKVLCCIFYMCIPKLISSHCSRDILFVSGVVFFIARVVVVPSSILVVSSSRLAVVPSDPFPDTPPPPFFQFFLVFFLFNLDIFLSNKIKIS
uniref:Transmembrane protein n=1 Tax=Cacopsylla melanoneura TaxID=428564 RepID=A0A8D8VA61_9HEMI